MADLAFDFGFPLIVVARNALGTINQTLQTLIAASVFREGLEVAAIVLNHPAPPGDDPSIATNGRELAARCVAPIAAEVAYGASEFPRAVDWAAFAGLTRDAAGGG